MLGTLVNTLTVLAGSLVGLLLRKSVNAERVAFVADVLGLFTVAIGVQMALQARKPVAMIVSLLLGSLVGEALGVEGALQRLSERVSRTRSQGVVDGMLTAFLTFCVGPMTVVGSIRDGLGDPSILLAKSVMDGVASVAYAAAMGVGVVFSSVLVLAFQGSLALLGALTGALLPEASVNELTAAGGVLLIGVGINLLKLKRIRVGNMLPALLLAPILALTGMP
ncbi:DUF554 domain-containing protein [Thermofilum pendens]|uniref:DUF554 domain-containing protein n=1 Tax=Thermofilum pendens (strain DSM 2475 / Hrk 5) TaxID=368408 RepID=A1S0F2_THEPD|nr:DUF554 domain-containing protein [Thermofilum pendens]ABL78932.1 protein of unknown function DUF554 [Thermofilum pendens Hrk 5]